MKKSLFLLASLGVFSLSQAQTLYVKSNTNVKIKPGALLYVEGQMKVDKYVRNQNGSDNQKVSNEGNVRITDNLVMGNLNNGADFVNELLPDGQYGQLIITGADANEGTVSSVLKFKRKGGKPVFTFFPFAYPFTPNSNSRAPYVFRDLFGLTNDSARPWYNKSFVGYTPGNGGDTHNGFDRERYKNVFFSWVNDGKPQLDNVKINVSTLEPGIYYSVNLNSDYASIPEIPDTSLLQGVPNKDELTITATPYKIPSNKAYNEYGEQYGSYIFDFTQAKPEGFGNYGQDDKEITDLNGFGSNIFMFGNPYTSNINLFGGTNSTFKNNNVVAIVQFNTKSSYDKAVNDKENGKEAATSKSDSYGGVAITAVTGDGAGDAKALYVRPYQTFAVKLKNSVTSPYDFTFTNDMKTFDIPNGDDAPENNLLSARAKEEGNKLNQVGLKLYDENGFTGVKTFVVASNIYEAAKKGRGVELTNIAIKDKDTALYTLQEDANGSVDAKLANDKAYINGINADKYVGKPIHVVLQNGKGQYTIKARLNQELANNKNAFYFEDKKEGKVLKIGKDFSYTFNAEGTDKDRFVLYWAKTPKAELSKDLAKEVKSSSVVYKDAAGTYKVRFDKAIKKADVFVYNISGQLVNVAKAVDTASDYVVPVKGNSSIYVVKVVGDNGSVTTKKIIK